MGTGVDNIEIDPETGDLWIGCHPLAYAILDFFDFFGYAHPSQVIKINFVNVIYLPRSMIWAHK